MRATPTLHSLTHVVEAGSPTDTCQPDVTEPLWEHLVRQAAYPANVKGHLTTFSTTAVVVRLAHHSVEVCHWLADSRSYTSSSGSRLLTSVRHLSQCALILFEGIISLLVFWFVLLRSSIFCLPHKATGKQSQVTIFFLTSSAYEIYIYSTFPWNVQSII